MLLLLLFGCPVMSDSLQPHGLQHPRPTCPSPSPRVCPSSCSLHRWCHPAVSTSDTLFSSSLNLSQHQELLQWIICVYHMTKILELQLWHLSFQGIFSWSPLRLTGLISLLSMGLSGVFSSTTVWRLQFFSVLHSLWSNSHNGMWPQGRPIALTVQTFFSRAMSLLFNTLSMFFIAFLPRSNHLISWLQSPSMVILESKKRKSVTTSTFSPFIYHAVMGPDAMILVFLISTIHCFSRTLTFTHTIIEKKISLKASFFSLRASNFSPFLTFFFWKMYITP